MQKVDKWYIVRSQANREKSVSEKILNESKKGDLIDKVSQVLVPMESSFYIKNNKKIKREKVMFPGYIFIESNSPSEVKEYLKGISGASGFLTNRSGQIQPLSQLEVNRMLGIQEEAKKRDLINPFILNEEVMIIDGPFNTMKGTIDEIVDERVKVSVSIFGRKTPIDLSIYQISRIN
jgi:transcription termination/antitermination protein NusG